MKLPRKSKSPSPKAPRALAESCVVMVTGLDRDGQPLARPVDWVGGRAPVVYMRPERSGQPALAPGARVIARLRRIGGDRYEGRTIKLLDRVPVTVIGVFRADQPSDPARGGRIEPVDRKIRADWLVPPGATGDATDGMIVRAEPLAGGGYGLQKAQIIDCLGDIDDARSISLIAIASLGIPDIFPPEALAEAQEAGPTRLGQRTDLRDVALVTIDGADARDFDDAVFAAPEHNGYRLIVAIADVASYVTPGSALDREARHRGNSVYFPDRVVPMLPEALSNGWCSLRPDEDRGCLFVEMRIGADGRKISHRFGRGLMRSAARLTYEQAQAAQDAQRDEGLPAGTIAHLFGAYQRLAAARAARGTLDLDLPERQITLGADGHVASVTPRPRLDSHRLIEEFMILANVAAAEELERLVQPCMYRVHAPPSAEKLDALRGLLSTFSISLKPGDQLHPRDLDQILRLVAGTPSAALVNEAILRSQSQAEYAPENIGHFGLGLRAYAHFTSPIRRYADLLVHRALITGLKLGADGLDADASARFAELGTHITITERRAADAERQSADRYLAAFLADRIGDAFDARISGVTRFGLFVTLLETGASGFVPFANLPEDFWFHDEASNSLAGRRSRVVYRLADLVAVRLVEARPVTGGLIFAIAAAAPAKAAARRGQAGDAPHDAAKPSKKAKKAKPEKPARKPARKGRRAKAALPT